jgi:hypothetical protein
VYPPHAQNDTTVSSAPSHLQSLPVGRGISASAAHHGTGLLPLTALGCGVTPPQIYYGILVCRSIIPRQILYGEALADALLPCPVCLSSVGQSASRPVVKAMDWQLARQCPIADSR